MAKDKTDELETKKKRTDLYNAWDRLFKLADKLLAQAEKDITSVRASMMQQIIRVLSNSGKILDDMEKFQRKTEAEPEVDPETGNEVMTSEEQEILDQFERSKAGYGEANDEADKSGNSGFKFRRDK